MPTPRLLLAALLVTSAVLLLACGSGDPEVVDDEPDGAADPVEDGDAEATLARTRARMATDGGAAASDSRELTLAIADAAERTGVAESDIEVEELSMVTWPDGAIGCPEPDVMYTQALVEGYRIVLDADGTQLHYHGAIGEDPFYCEDPQEPVPATE
jgi:hypothetical protein